MKNDPQVRQNFIESNYDEAVLAYRMAKEGGVEDPVVMILDLRDSMAAKVVGLVKDQQHIKVALHDHALKNEAATVIMAVERGVAGKVVSNFSPSARKALGCGLPLLACVAAGGTAYAHMEVGR